ncbi:type IV toxin-antitoxin system AbiEi family antitoxin domain-containing protein [Paraburkholderia sp. BL18I3N2]|uniref:type IV toxin-antitoxin system AbiEi family antitoxin domain-containing protein n=1 Tax=Paraburkholderia sp. BL18I3N2 TaxID=1938799 RepID=UPI0035BE3532
MGQHLPMHSRPLPCSTTICPTKRASSHFPLEIQRSRSRCPSVPFWNSPAMSGKGQSLKEAGNLMVSLRADVLDEYSRHCHRAKVVRLVRDLGREADFAWSREVQNHVDRLDAGKRWSNKTKNGRKHSNQNDWKHRPADARASRTTSSKRLFPIRSCNICRP